MGISHSDSAPRNAADHERSPADLECAAARLSTSVLAPRSASHGASDAGVEQVVADEKNCTMIAPDQEIDLPALDQGETGRIEIGGMPELPLC